MNFLKRAGLTKDYKDVFSTEAGQRVLMDLVREGSFLQNTFKGDVNGMLLKEGKRNMVLYILSIIKTDLSKLLDAYERQSKENEND